MKTMAWIILALLIGSSMGARAETSPAVAWPGLVAHYFADRKNWNGNWPDTVSVPDGNPSDWTFTEYQYSRVEPVINHLFIQNGWFSVRWAGYIDPSVTVGSSPASVSGAININPNNSDQNEFTLTLENGEMITRDQLARDYAGYSGSARSIHVKPKGNGNQNGLIVNGQPYPMMNSETYDITAEDMEVRLYNDKISDAGKAMGQWWIALTAENATVSCAGRDTSDQPAGAEHEYSFEILADDGCRLFIDGATIINDWRACSEKSPEALRKSQPVKLTSAPHRFIVEYFQGQSLRTGDHDPITLYWSCPSRNIQRQIVPASAFSHDDRQTASSGR